jgi:isopropylmalate/homocitrate/citramalate synthase
MAQRPAEPWHTDQWFVSPWNFNPEVTAEFQMPQSVKIHDTTLRDGEQQVGVVLNADDKVRIAEALGALGVHRIEAGLPAVSPDDAAAVRRIANLGLSSEIYAFARCVPGDAKIAADCGCTGVVMEIPASRHLIEKAYGWTMEKAIDLSIQTTAMAHELGLKVVFFPIDASRASMVELMDHLSRVAKEGHADSIVLVDSFGVISPHAVRFFARHAKERLGLPFETHFHSDFAMGVANTLIAVAEGAEAIHTTVLGIGERAGNTPMEETVMALLMMYGIDTGIKTEKFYETARLVQQLTGVTQPQNRSITGTDLFYIESGIPVAWLRKLSDADMTELFPFRPELVGQAPYRVALGKGSGLDSIAIWMDKIGLKWTESDQLRAILNEVKAISLAEKRLLDADEFSKIALRTIPNAKA